MQLPQHELQTEMAATPHNNEKVSIFNVTGDEMNDASEMTRIPNLVNRILMEHYSPSALSPTYYKKLPCKRRRIPPTSSKNGTTAANSSFGMDNDNSIHIPPKNALSNVQYTANNDVTDKKRKEKEEMTLLLTAVIVEFAQPHFVNVTRFKEQQKEHQRQQEEESKRKESIQSSKSAKLTSPPKVPSTKRNATLNSPTKVLDSTNRKSPSLEFDERAITWATQCLKRLLQPSIPSLRSLPPSTSVSMQTPFGSSDTMKNANTSNNNVDNFANSNNISKKQQQEIHIPELDALLSATGSNDDGMEMEYKLQCALLGGLQGRRMIGID